jgi:hypothetical protein
MDIKPFRIPSQLVILMLVSTSILTSCSKSEPVSNSGLTPAQIRKNQALYQECIHTALNNTGTDEEQEYMLGLCSMIELG